MSRQCIGADIRTFFHPITSSARDEPPVEIMFGRRLGLIWNQPQCVFGSCRLFLKWRLWSSQLRLASNPESSTSHTAATMDSSELLVRVHSHQPRAILSIHLGPQHSKNRTSAQGVGKCRQPYQSDVLGCDRSSPMHSGIVTELSEPYG
jgi:hypothetical protein